MLKEWYREPRWIGKGEEKQLIPTVLDCFKLKMKQPLFKLAIILNAHVAMEVAPGEDPTSALNPLKKLWMSLDKNLALVKTFGEYAKVALITMVHVLSSIEDERTFFNLIFFKNNLQNSL